MIRLACLRRTPVWLWPVTSIPLLAIVAMASCVEDLSLNPLPADEDGVIPTYVVVTVDSADWPTSPIDITNTLIVDDTLTFDVEYGGGCETHLFAFVVSGSFMESEPVQTTALLSHDQNGDECLALIQDALKADLAPLREEYQRSYQTASGVIVITYWAPRSVDQPRYSPRRTSRKWSCWSIPSWVWKRSTRSRLRTSPHSSW